MFQHVDRNVCYCLLLFFFNDTATTEIYTLSLHDALPISWLIAWALSYQPRTRWLSVLLILDRKSTRLNSSHGYMSYAVFCLKKKNTLRANIHLRPTAAIRHRARSGDTWL